MPTNRTNRRKELKVSKCESKHDPLAYTMHDATSVVFWGRLTAQLHPKAQGLRPQVPFTRGAVTCKMR